MAHSAIDIAGYFIHYVPKKRRLTPIEIQKLVYIAHGWNLGATGEPLVVESIEAWMYGPVIRRLYDEVKHFGSGEITAFAKPAKSIFSDYDKTIMDWVWEQYGTLQGFQLSALTHKADTPWDEIFNKKGYNLGNATIPNDLIQSYYKNMMGNSQ
ncbi:MAG: DUF4065 domain-containing protein [Candidatus Electryonea clarkiae]|nr:DUF4065 domain-containing protein [Candidatus Electryonea clarkiae]MDP8288836.1 DUF4065 domain-containing protein [Candidatus Electryonea clarkiae]